MKLDDFFYGIENQKAFSYIKDGNGEFIPVKNPEYNLYFGTIYPFTIFGEELNNINEYCYEISKLILEKYNDALNDLTVYRDLDENQLPYSLYNDDVTYYEILIGYEHSLYMWENILWQGAYHLIVLLYAFLERTIQAICDLFPQKNDFTAKKVKRPKLYHYLEQIFNMDVQRILGESSNSYRIIEEARQFRNQFVHGTFRKTNDKDIFTFDEIKEYPTFRIIDLINVIVYILDLSEEQYINLPRNKKHEQ